MHSNSIIFPRIESIMISEICVFPLYKSKSFLRQKYVEEKLSVTEISRLVFSARSTVVRNLEAFGIVIRAEDRVRKPKYAPYGQRRIKGQEIEYKRELEVIEKARALRGQGYSFQKIANILNTMKLPTKTKKAKWYPKTVRDIILRPEAAESGDRPREVEETS
jgi:hypothetical protein